MYLTCHIHEGMSAADYIHYIYQFEIEVLYSYHLTIKISKAIQDRNLFVIRSPFQSSIPAHVFQVLQHQ